MATAPTRSRSRSRPMPRPQARKGELLVEGASLLVALGWGFWNVLTLLPVRSPQLLPYASDYWEYLGFTAHFLDPSAPAPPAFRHPLFPWLASQLCTLFDLSPSLGNLWIAVIAAGLIPVALYLLARQIAPPFVALCGALLGGSLPVLVDSLGLVSDYLFCTWVLVLSAAACLWATRRGNLLAYAAAGISLAALMAATPKALTWLVIAIPLLSLRALLGVRAQPRGPVVRLLFLLVPLVAVWWLFARSPLLYNSLEHATDLVFSDCLGHVPVTSVHPTPGELWPADRGWIVGEWSSLFQIPRTLEYLREIGAIGRSGVHFQSGFWVTFMEQFSRGRGLWLFPVMGLLGCLGPATVRRRPTPWIPTLLVIAMVSAFFLSSLVASASLPPRLRYHLTAILILPVFAPAGGAFLLRLLPVLRRAAEWPWLVLPLLCLWLVEFSDLPVGRPARLQRAALLADREEPVMAPFAALQQLRPELLPDDHVLDLAPNGEVRAMLLHAVVIEAYPSFGGAQGAGGLTLYPQGRGRRLLFGGCAETHLGDNHLWKILDSAGDGVEPRLQRLSPCLLEDTRPRRPGVLRPG